MKVGSCFFYYTDPLVLTGRPLLSPLSYTPQSMELEHSLKPFIPDFIPAVGDIDAFLKVRTHLSAHSAVPFKCLSSVHFKATGVSILVYGYRGYRSFLFTAVGQTHQSTSEQKILLAAGGNCWSYSVILQLLE